MKFKCEICGATFDKQNECATHEGECRTHHEVLLYLNDELNKLITAATYQKVTLNVEVSNGDDQTKTEIYSVQKADFDAAKNKITIHVNPKEKKPEEKKAAKKNEESSKKS